MKKDDVILLIDFIEIHEEGHSMAYIQYLKDLVYSSKDGSCLENNKPFAIPDVSPARRYPCDEYCRSKKNDGTGVHSSHYYGEPAV